MLIYKLGIPVAEIALDGQYNVTENMQFTNGLGSEDINTFTVCFRFNVEFLRPEITQILSYSTFLHDNTLEALIWFNSDNILSISFCKYWGYASKGITKLCSSHYFKSIRIHDHWYHACWLVNTDGVESDQIKIHTKLFYDGKEVDNGDTMLISTFIHI